MGLGEERGGGAHNALDRYLTIGRLWPLLLAHFQFPAHAPPPLPQCAASAASAALALGIPGVCRQCVCMSLGFSSFKNKTQKNPALLSYNSHKIKFTFLKVW